MNQPPNSKLNAQQAIVIAEAIEEAERAKLSALRERRARPPSFLYTVAGLRHLPASVQEELFTHAKWRAIRNWRFLLLASITTASSAVALWWLARNYGVESTLLAATVPAFFFTAVSVPFVRAELRELVRERSKCNLTRRST
jgi:hypothetical protein